MCLLRREWNYLVHRFDNNVRWLSGISEKDRNLMGQFWRGLEVSELNFLRCYYFTCWSDLFSWGGQDGKIWRWNRWDLIFGSRCFFKFADSMASLEILMIGTKKWWLFRNFLAWGNQTSVIVRPVRKESWTGSVIAMGGLLEKIVAVPIFPIEKMVAVPIFIFLFFRTTWKTVLIRIAYSRISSRPWFLVLRSPGFESLLRNP